MLRRVITVLDQTGQEITGQIIVDQEETRWQLRPDRPWPRGQCAVVVTTDLEDLAGNSVGRPFEVDVFRAVERQVTTGTVRLPFLVGTESAEAVE